jgi:competence protein ComEC
VRYLLRPVSIEGLPPADMPRRVRLTASARHVRAAPGEAISGTARLLPFSGPIIPAGHDFGFSNWFSDLGATGYFLGRPHISDAPVHSTFGDTILAEVHVLRSAMTDRIRQAVGGEAGDICAALITGERLAVDEATEESFRRSGLAHILSISGLHMVLVTLTVVWGMRFLLALSPRLAVNWPIRKWAAATGFVSATFYLLLSGAEVPTQRSYVMIAIMLAALLADRRAMDLRNVALAAIAILCLTPEALLSPGFQMSFAAAAALVSAFSAWSRWQRGRVSGGRAGEPRAGYLRMAAGHVGGLAATSIIAGIATGLFAAWHFNQIAPMGLIANLAAMPVTSFITMPLALLGVLLMPFGLEKLALVPMGWSVGVVIAISDWVNGFPVPDATGRQPLAVLLLGTTGLLLLILLRTRLRFA